MANPEPAPEGGVARLRLDASLRAGERMHCAQPFERLLALFRQCLIRGMRITEFGIAAPRRWDLAAKERPQDRHLVEIAVEMPEERCLGVFRENAGGRIDGDRGGPAVGVVGRVFAER